MAKKPEGQAPAPAPAQPKPPRKRLTTEERLAAEAQKWQARLDRLNVDALDLRDKRSALALEIRENDQERARIEKMLAAMAEPIPETAERTKQP